MIFNYGYGCCAFAYNICGSQPVVPNGMLDTSKPLSQELFINPQCPPGVVHAKVETIDVPLGEAYDCVREGPLVAVLEADISEAGEHLFAAEVRLGNEPDSSARVTGGVRNLMSLAGARGCILPLLVEPCSSTHVLYPRFLLFCNQAP